MRKRSNSSRDGGRRATARSAGRTTPVPWIACRRTEQVVARILVSVMRCVGLAEDDPSSETQSGSNPAVEIRYVLLEEFRTVRGAQATGWLQVFDGHRQAVEHTQRLAAHDGLLRGARCGASRLRVEGDEGVDDRLELLGTSQDIVQQFDR